MRLQNKVAVITGAAQGIGAGIAARLAADGAAVVIADVDIENGRAGATKVAEAGGQARFIACDVSDPAQVEALFDETLNVFGRLDVLVNNAALVHYGPGTVHFLQMPREVWHRTLAVNLSGMFYCSQRAAAIMVKQGEGGCIINISSGGGSRAHRHLLAYDTTKGGIEAATRCMAVDLAPWQIRANAIAPGNVRVEKSTPVGSSDIQPADVIPLGRPGTPEDIAGLAAFLASDDAAYLTGQRIQVDGGMAAQLRSPAVDIQIDPGIADRL